MKQKTPLTAGKPFDAHALTKRQARALLEKACPWLIKPKRLRSIVRRAVRKTQTKEFADKLEAVLSLMDTVHDLTEQESAMNPRLLAAQRDGTITKKIRTEFRNLMTAWEELLQVT